MILVQLSAAQGPEECTLAVTKAFRQFTREAGAQGLTVTPLEEKPALNSGCWRSLLLGVEGDGAKKLAESWAGTLQWTCQSPFRPAHPRKNWFIGVFAHDVPDAVPQDMEIRFETMRAGGPGGQHVNKTETAVRATHLATGLSVKVSTERSQLANKKLALALLLHRLAEQAGEKQASQVAERRLMHHRVNRGNPSRVFKGEDFKPV